MSFGYVSESVLNGTLLMPICCIYLVTWGYFSYDLKLMRSLVLSKFVSSVTVSLETTSQPVITCSKITIETLE